VDAREPMVRERGDGRECRSTHAKTPIWWHEHRLLRKIRVMEWCCSWPAETSRSWGSEEGRELRRAKGLGWTESRGHGAIVEAMEGVESSLCHC
jgi:hypothetical protein